MAENGTSEIKGEALQSSVHQAEKISVCNGNGNTGHRLSRDDNSSFCSEESIDSPLDFSFKRRNGESEISSVDSPLSPGSNTDGRKSSENNDHSVYNGLQSNVNHAREAEQIGEPKVASPGTHQTFSPELAGMMQMFQAGVLPGSAASMLGAFPTMAALMDPKISQSNKSTRPFKAYPKEALSLPLGCYGIPGLNPFQSFDTNLIQSLNGEDLLNLYKQHLQTMQDHPSDCKQSHKSSTVTSASGTSSNTGISSNNTSQQHRHHHHHHHHHSHHNISAPAISSPSMDQIQTQPIPGTSGLTAQHHSNARKRPRTLPDEQKDEAYWERRRKNNDAAKRSRDARRAKEDEIAIRAALLEQENLKLRVEVAALKTETAKLRCMLYNS